MSSLSSTNNSTSARAKKNAALARFKAAKSSAHSALDELDEYASEEDDDSKVYDVMSEDEYRKLVQARRERDDFVVDDDGLGYHDDGEEHWEEEEDSTLARNAKARTAQVTAALTTKALHKARKVAKLTATMSSSGTTTTTTDMKNHTMWEFLNKGTTTIGGGSTSSTKSTTTSNSRNNKAKNRGGSASSSGVNLDDLLSELDDAVSTSTTINKKRRAGVPPPPSSRGVTAMMPPPPSRRPRTSYGGSTTSSTASKHYHQSSHHDDNDDCDNDFAAPDFNDDDNNNSKFAPREATAENDDTTMMVSNNDNNNSSNKSVRFASPIAAEKQQEQQQQQQQAESIADDQANATTESAAPAPPTARHRVLARPKLLHPPVQSATTTAAATSNAATDAKAGGTSSVSSSIRHTAATSNFASDLATISDNVVTATTAAASGGPTSASAGQIDLSLLLQHPPKPESSTNEDSTTSTPEEESTSVPYLDMFWMDIYERNGDIVLFGKVAYQGSFVSTCCLVQGCVRNLYVLPRPNSSMQDVHSELSQCVLKQVLPHKAGVSWRGKPVHRHYAFDDPDIPRSTQYMKVVYSSQFPVPSQDVCQNGGQHFRKILCSNNSILETFLIKRKLKGPCWIRLSSPQARSHHGPLSWCKVECQINNPKQIVPISMLTATTTTSPNGDGGGTSTTPIVPPPPPPLVTVTLKFQTTTTSTTSSSGVGHAKTEIVAVAAMCHKHMSLEGSNNNGNDTKHHQQHLCLIRPLSASQPFPRDIDKHLPTHPQVRKEVNERAMLSRLMAQIGQWDPDVIVGHNIWGYELELLLSRCQEFKVATWSKIGRCRRSDAVKMNAWGLSTAVAGRLVCDSYLSAKELLRETTYSLSNLAATQLKTNRVEIEALDVPHWYQNSQTIVQLALHTLLDAQLVQRLMLQLQILPLTHQLTCVAGNLWSHTLKSNRAERTEYLLLHEFHRLKYIPPEKKKSNKLDKSTKAKYAGGLVLEPKKGLYDSFILLLDFNSLYPSIIQEYNLCFTTIQWAQYKDEDENNLPPIPDNTVERGVLPRVIQSLVERRRAVKKMLKAEKNPQKKAELDIRQQALKLTANSMYGCLGFSNSRFFAQPIAAMVTSLGRETLQRTVDIAQNTVGLEVIYGDTDSIMINTRLNAEQDLRQVKELGERVKKEVNRLYKTLELEIDGIFRSMLLLKKKKYAAKTVEELPDGTIKYGQELKGLDLVRRDWCVQSKDTGRYVTEQILSGQDSEVVVEKIFAHLEMVAEKMRSGALPLEKYIITKGLSKHPNDYPDGKSQPHVQVAKMMLEDNRPVNTGDHIPYVITAAAEEMDPNSKAPSAAERARHPEDIARSDGALKPDVEWYLVQQILPPVARLCEPIEGLSQPVIAEKLGLDGSRFNHASRSSEANDDELIDYTPASLLKDEERFKSVRKLRLYCTACGVGSDFPGVFQFVKDDAGASQALVSGLRCTNPDCRRPMFWGQSNHFECFSRISNAMTIWVRGLMTEYYEGLVRCDEPGCGMETRQLSVAGNVCLRRGCHGQLVPVDSERELCTHLKYLETLFDGEHASQQLGDKLASTGPDGKKTDYLKQISVHDRATFEELHQVAKTHLDSSAYNWITPSFWKGLFDTKVKQ